MFREPCKRTWEIEALEDGRLVDKDRGSLERHMVSCEDCTRASARLRQLGTLLAGLPAPVPTDLDRRRDRAALLARANGAVVTGEPSRWRGSAFVPVLIAIALVVFAVRGRTWKAPVPSTEAALAPLFEVADVAHADFSAERVGGTARVALRSGVASFHVEHVKAGARFVVALPDGEVEVRGTRFVVDVAGGHTRSVTVTEGFVDVRVRGFEGTLLAGERWPKVEGTGPAPAGSPPSAPIATPTTPPTLIATPTTPPTSAPVAAAPSPPQPLPGPRFAEAMRAFNAGDYGEADRLFAAFALAYPSDTRAEDAMFLLADARMRRGDAASAREAARAYLDRFPKGLRAPAAERIADDSATP